uniref:Toxin ICK-10 n=1 Tax=Trittame loki TaxID=1295018 RepID=ICK10_TRILK|nr:RecName: Full=Toxin ICK-10; Flags: Precursor [Trittame loki]
MMKLYSLVIIATLAAAAFAATKQEIAAAALSGMVHDFEQYAKRAEGEEEPKRYIRCSKQLGEKCDLNCECCGASAVCEDYNYICKEKVSDNPVLDWFGQGLNAMGNAISRYYCDAE